MGLLLIADWNITLLGLPRLADWIITFDRYAMLAWVLLGSSRLAEKIIG